PVGVLEGLDVEAVDDRVLVPEVVDHLCTVGPPQGGKKPENPRSQDRLFTERRRARSSTAAASASIGSPPGTLAQLPVTSPGPAEPSGGGGPPSAPASGDVPASGGAPPSGEPASDVPPSPARGKPKALRSRVDPVARATVP